MPEVSSVEQHLDQTARSRQSYPYYAFFISLFQLLFGAFLWLYRRRDSRLEQVSALDVGLLGLATLRLSKAISEDEVSAVLREPVVEETGDHKEPQGHGFRWALGKLILCPTCTGTWVAALLTYALHLSPRNTRPFLAAMSASGISQFADALLCLVYTDRDVLRNRHGM